MPVSYGRWNRCRDAGSTKRGMGNESKSTVSAGELLSVCLSVWYLFSQRKGADIRRSSDGAMGSSCHVVHVSSQHGNKTRVNSVLNCSTVVYTAKPMDRYRSPSPVQNTVSKVWATSSPSTNVPNKSLFVKPSSPVTKPCSFPTRSPPTASSR